MPLISTPRDSWPYLVVDAILEPLRLQEWTRLSRRFINICVHFGQNTVKRNFPWRLGIVDDVFEARSQSVRAFLHCDVLERQVQR
ncbi:hypothetical protein AURDEDRAFT_113678 [Auricularia subglabra TFB-10046 SS5]|nr:hypothetical protein AURDEDRAFT_113678 [Auricularia subglabra TFB-10046 SS5]